MFDEWLVSRLSKNAWALLGALLLLRRPESTFTNGELAFRSAMSKSSVVAAKQELVSKGLVTVTDVAGQPSVIRLNIQPEGFADEQDQEMAQETGRLARSEAPQIQTPDVLRLAIDKFNRAFPQEMIDPIFAKRMYATAGTEDRLVYAINKTIDKKPQHPKGYALSICRSQEPIDTPQPPPPELVAFTERAREYAKATPIRTITERRAAAKRGSH